MNKEQLALMRKTCDVTTKNERDIQLLIKEVNDLKARENNKTVIAPQVTKELRFETTKQLAQFEMDFVKTHLLSIIEKFGLISIYYK